MPASATRFLTALVALPHGDPFLGALTRFLVDALAVDLAFIAALEGESLVPLALARPAGAAATPAALPLAGSPCEVVLAEGRLLLPDGLAAAFPGFAPVADQALEGYAGVALHDDAGRPIGVVAVASARPLDDAATVAELLDLVAPRARLELRGRRARAQLAESEERYRKLVELSPDMVMVHAEGRWVFANATAARALGARGPDALIGRPIADLLPAPLVDDFRACCAGAGCQGAAPDGFELRRLDGRTLEVTSASAAITLGGKPACMVVFRDVTERRRAARALQASEARFRSVVATAAEAIVLANEDGEIILWNPGATRIFGYEMTETLGRPIAMLMPARFREAHDRGLAEAARRGIVDPRRPIELVGRRKDGTEFPIELSLTSWEADGHRYFTGLIRDVSERRAVERMKDEFIAMVSHELRTPLNTITCSLDLLSSGALGEPGGKAARILEIAQANTDRLSRIVGDMLDLQVLAQGRLPMVRERCEVQAFVRDALDTCRPMADRRDVMIEADVLPGLACEADAGRMTQLLVNLVVNAIRYSPRGGRIDVVATAGRDEIRVRVDDQGPGVPPDQRELVFERFHQAAPPPEGQEPGTGLGLAICQAIVRQHGGRIWVAEGPRGGAAFHFTIPARP